MPLKRGLVRESCDFCYRRKVKCDRLSLASQGITSCSQCALRDLECRVKDSDDARIRRRNRLISSSRNHNGGLNTDTNSSPRSEIPCPAFVPETPVTHATVSRSGHSKGQNENTSPLIAPEYLTVDDTFGLSLDNMLFLDQVFLNEGSFDWSMMNNQDDHEIDEQTSTTYSSTIIRRFQTPDNLEESSTLTAALRSYFNLAALHLPILVEDAFWQDFYSGRCSPALIYAIACRGMPFTTAENKLDLEQRYANQFRKAFLEARSAPSGNGTVRLDELEALALMIDYDYEEDENENESALHSNLGSLFLTHDALILLMLQNRICDTTGLESSPESLANAAQRRMLLYWHIYGLDAFHCLDRKQSSHIHIPNTDSENKISNIEIRDYFDAMVSLATIAREIIQKLCTISAKRQGVDPKHVYGLYDQLHYWSKTLCPRHLRRNYQEDGELKPFDRTPQDEPEPSSSTKITRKQKHTHLRRAVLWALEFHCFLQIEAIVADYGIKYDNKNLLEADVLAARIEYESVRVLNGMASVCRWISQYEIEDDSGHTTKRHSLVDLAPNILRNICAGMCYWSAQRGIELCQRGPSELLRISRHRSMGKDDGGDMKFQIVSTYIETASLLRETAATATSHNQTKQVLERIDHQLGLVGRHFESLRGVNC
ncbi:hypothetical protein TCE0_015f01763 [Talaromyces pinophilus]|uniref:Zn(2)-C6 fungal-type domain-containing protein n=1 Tax=Talaromyces pinophilus TaxID=128442 RepID=A0A6V8GYZ6_TALPI|nr:hypothetical protein TCE0_015f01763 [Talaromyces pinophilus]